MAVKENKGHCVFAPVSVKSLNVAASDSWQSWLWPCPHLLPLQPLRIFPALPGGSHPRAQGQRPEDRGISSLRGRAVLREARGMHQSVWEEGGCGHWALAGGLCPAQDLRVTVAQRREGWLLPEAPDNFRPASDLACKI